MLKFENDTITLDEEGVIFPSLDELPQIGPDNPLSLYDARPDVLGQRFCFDADAFGQAQFLLNAPDQAAYRILLMPKDDERISKRGVCGVDKWNCSSDWNLYIPVSDRFEYSEESLHYINVSLLAQVRVSSHVHALQVQYAGNVSYANAAFTASLEVVVADSFNQARVLVDNGLTPLVPSESPAGMELLDESTEDADAVERTEETDPGD